MPKCGIIRKSDLKACTNEGKEPFKWKCGIHKNSKRKPKILKILTKPTTKSLTDSIPTVLINIIGKYMNVSDYVLNDSNLQHFKYLYNTFKPSFNIATSIPYLNNIMINNNIESIKYLNEVYSSTMKEYFPTLHDQRRDVLVQTLKNNHFNMFKWVVETYNPNMMKYFFDILDIKNNNIFEYCSNDMIKFIFNKVIESDLLEYLVNYTDANYQFFLNILLKIVTTKNIELFYYMLSPNFYPQKFMSNFCDDNMEELIKLYDYALNIDDLKLADLCHENLWKYDEFREVIYFNYEVNKMYDISKKKCKEGKIDTIQYIMEYNDIEMLLDYPKDSLKIIKNLITIANKYRNTIISDYFQNNFLHHLEKKIKDDKEKEVSEEEVSDKELSEEEVSEERVSEERVSEERGE